jgi:ABC-type amino acid transport substrate-binding protein
MALSGQVDGEIMRIYSYGAKHPQLIRVPSPYYSLETTVFTLKNRSITVRTKDDLRGYTIVVVRGVQHTADMTEGLSGVTEVNSTEQMMQFLKAGRADIALANRIDGIAVLSRLKIDSIVPRTTLNTLNLYCYMHPKRKDLVPRLDRAIREMTASGQLTHISRDAEAAVLGRH